MRWRASWKTSVPRRHEARVDLQARGEVAVRRATRSLLLCSWLALVMGTTAVAQQAPRPTFTTPDEFFEQFDAFLPGSRQQDQRDLEAITIRPADERRFGQQMVAAYKAQLKRQGLRIVQRGSDVEYLEALVATLQPHMQHSQRYRKITVYVIDSPQTDARSFPGGTLFFYRGLLDFAPNEAALIAIVGHELSHLDRGHQLLPLKQGKLLEQTFAGSARGFDLDRFFRAGMTMTRLVSRPFRPEDEALADADGVRWAYRAGYDPRELARLFVRLHERDRAKGEHVPSFFRTHPYSLDRSEAVLRQFEELSIAEPRDTLYIGRENLERRTARSVAEWK